jgi:hypothetical protein
MAASRVPSGCDFSARQEAMCCPSHADESVAKEHPRAPFRRRLPKSAYSQIDQSLPK